MYPDAEFLVVNNAVQSERFLFDQHARNEIRTALGIEDCIVLGHVGRFSKPKNHSFLLDVFYEVRKLRPDSVLMLVGDGELKEAIEKKATELGLTDSILFMGRRSDVGQLMSAMDVFVLPSLYEGLGNVLIEAQFNGLPCAVSEEAYNEEVEISSLLTRVSLNSEKCIWVNSILESATKLSLHRTEPIALDTDNYDINHVVAELQKIYLNH